MSFITKIAFLYMIICCTAEDGQWHATDYGNTGKYIPGDEGKYVHIHNPYGGGYGPYGHVLNPYKHIDNPYKHVDKPYVPEEDPLKEEESVEKQYVAPTPVYKYVLTDKEDNPYFKPGYYRNNGIKIIRHDKDHTENKYKYVYETENKILAEEQAKIKRLSTDKEGISSSGYYQYIGPDGFLYRVDYTADEHGFVAKPSRIATKYSGSFVKVKAN